MTSEFAHMQSYLIWWDSIGGMLNGQIEFHAINDARQMTYSRCAVT
jgi:hypothetical protein